MDAEKVINLFDFCWFKLEIFNKKPSSSNSSTFEVNPDSENQVEASNQVISRIPSLHTRSMSENLSFTSGSLSPKLKTIHSGKEITESEDQSKQEQMHKKKTTSRRRRSKSETKSLSDLEFVELKGFMDLGFVFSEEDKDSSLSSIIPGLQRLGKQDDEKEEVLNESDISRPYLSETWEVLDKGLKRERNPLMNWRFPSLSNEIDMKDNLRWWAHTVASTVR